MGTAGEASRTGLANGGGLVLQPGIAPSAGPCFCGVLQWPLLLIPLPSLLPQVVFHGSTIAQWRKAGYQDQPEHAAFKQLLQVGGRLAALPYQPSCTAPCAGRWMLLHAVVPLTGPHAAG